MIIVNCEQRSQEWFESRLGKPSASNFSKIITDTGKKSIQWDAYMNTLIAETLTGKKQQSFQSSDMEYGINMEEEARNFYSFHLNMDVQQVGTIYKDDKKLYCASPDGLRKDRGVEIKCPKASTHVEYLYASELPSKYIPQVQGGMLVTGFSCWDFMSYFPGLKHVIITVKRDISYLASLEFYLNEFITEMNEKLEELKCKN